MTGARRPHDRHDGAGPGRARRDRAVWSSRDHRDRGPGVEQWQFITEVRPIDGAEGQWLHRELAVAVRELLVWAREDMSSHVHSDQSDEEQAA